MNLEIERKFLVDKEAWAGVNKGEGTYYKQGYLLNDPVKTVRVRISARDAYLTIKGATTGASRLEFEYPIPLDQARVLLESFADAALSKTRYELVVGGKTWEVDEFLEDNEGLLVAEIELDSEDEVFEKPSWVGEEVTSDSRYYNAYLVKYPYKTW